jgi:hypothetical protein
MANLLAQKALLIRLNVRTWQGRKLDKTVTQDANEAAGASHDAGRYNKSLVSQTALARIVTAQGATRSYHYSVTHAWNEDGARLLPVVTFNDYRMRMKALKAEFDAAVTDFLSSYQEHIETAKTRLGKMFNAAEYPPASDLAGRFSMTLNILPVPDSADFRADLSEEQASMIRMNIDNQIEDAVSAVTRQCVQRVADAVGHMAARLNEYKPGTSNEKAAGTFKDSLVDNVRDLVASLPSLNLIGDESVTALIADMERALTPNDASTLRNNDSERKAVATEADLIYKRAMALLG